MYSVNKSYSFGAEPPVVSVQTKYLSTEAKEVKYTDRSSGTLMREARIPRDKPTFAGGTWLSGH
jgi:hypothetical protein